MNEKVEAIYKQMLGLDELPEKLSKTYDGILFMLNRVDGTTRSNPQILALIAAIAGCVPEKSNTEVEQISQPQAPAQTPKGPVDKSFPAGAEVLVFYEDKPRHGRVFSASDRPDMIRVTLINDTEEYREVPKDKMRLRD